MKKIVTILAVLCMVGFAQNGLTDSRDGKTYKTIKIGNQTWIAENMNFEIVGSKCYGDNPANCRAYGRLYNWDMAKNACPAGSYLPSDVEWRELMLFTGTNDPNDNNKNSAAGWKLRAKTGWNPAKADENNIAQNINGTDVFGFAAMPGGVYASGGFSRASDFGYWYTSAEINAQQARVIYFGNTVGTIGKQDVDKKGIYASVRCIVNAVPAVAAAPAVAVAPAPATAPAPIEAAPVVETQQSSVFAIFEAENKAADEVAQNAPASPAPSVAVVDPQPEIPQSIPANVGEESGSKKKSSFKPVVSIGLAVGGLGAIVYGLMKDKEVAKFVDERNGPDAVDAESSRNIGYITGSILLASGATFYIFF